MNQFIIIKFYIWTLKFGSIRQEVQQWKNYLLNLLKLVYICQGYRK